MVDVVVVEGQPARVRIRHRRGRGLSVLAPAGENDLAQLPLELAPEPARMERTALGGAHHGEDLLVDLRQLCLVDPAVAQEVDQLGDPVAVDRVDDGGLVLEEVRQLGRLRELPRGDRLFDLVERRDLLVVPVAPANATAEHVGVGEWTVALGLAGDPAVQAAEELLCFSARVLHLVTLSFALVAGTGQSIRKPPLTSTISPVM